MGLRPVNGGRGTHPQRQRQDSFANLLPPRPRTCTLGGQAAPGEWTTPTPAFCCPDTFKMSWKAIHRHAALPAPAHTPQGPPLTRWLKVVSEEHFVTVSVQIRAALWRKHTWTHPTSKGHQGMPLQPGLTANRDKQPRGWEARLASRTVTGVGGVLDPFLSRQLTRSIFLQTSS